MKKKLALLAFVCTASIWARTDKTFLTVKPHSMNLVHEMLISQRVIEDLNEDQKGFVFQTTPFYQASVNDKDLARYFLLNNKDTLAFATQTNNINADVDPRHFDLSSSYQGSISLRPTQKVVGNRVDYYYNFGYKVKGLFAGISPTIVHIENSPKLFEEIDSRAGFETILTAFSGGDLSSSWAENFQYGKINGKQSDTEIEGVDLKIGWRALKTDNLKLAINGVFTIPTGHEATSKYLFEPVSGLNKHFGLGVGVHGDLRIAENSHDDTNWYLVGAANYKYIFQDKEVRTLELKNKRWGRYLKMRKQNPRSTTNVLASAYPGVNALTREVKVTPGSHFEGLAALQYKAKGWGFNVGYNGWLKENESLKLRKSFSEPGIFGIVSSNATAGMPAETASVAVSSLTTIKEFQPADGQFIQQHDVDFNGSSAAGSHKLFAMLNFESEGKVEFFGSLAASYEIAQKNNSLEQWSAWGSLGIAF
ncbi:hypothetical protein KAW80_02215 [Candidatus Babeliales bacterium]|nr:hypothetical protein [Candidatus Babeliales bacterium]